MRLCTGTLTAIICIFSQESSHSLQLSAMHSPSDRSGFMAGSAVLVSTVSPARATVRITTVTLGPGTMMFAFTTTTDVQTDHHEYDQANHNRRESHRDLSCRHGKASPLSVRYLLR